ncbi:DUF6167 family protein [Streptantibioticus parmotrematis]|uniref:DUF6167 family protein n=1 Tax=Streptantibioticus parmotrematis TaxID=2873249 RepID=UPI0033ECA060
MFRRLFWFVAGVSTGVWATTKVNRAVRRLSPDSLAATAADRALELGGRARQFAIDVRAGMTEREAELGGILGTDDQPGPEPAPHRAVLPVNRPQITYRGHVRSRVHPQDHQQKEGH